MTIPLSIPIEISHDIFNVGGLGTKYAKSQCGTGSEGQRTLKSGDHLGRLAQLARASPIQGMGSGFQP